MLNAFLLLQVFICAKHQAQTPVQERAAVLQEQSQESPAHLHSDSHFSFCLVSSGLKNTSLWNLLSTESTEVGQAELTHFRTRGTLGSSPNLLVFQLIWRKIQV